MTSLAVAERERHRQNKEVLELSSYWDYTDFDPIRIQIQLRPVKVRELEPYLAAQTRQMQSASPGDRSYLIIEARDGNRPTPEVRRRQAEWLEANRELIARTCTGISFVITHRIVRGALTAIFWVSRPPVPIKVHSTLDEALAYAIGVCDEAGLELPFEARRPDASARIESALERVTLRRALP